MAEGKKGFFGRLVEGLTKTRNNIVSGIDSIFSGFSAIDDDKIHELETRDGEIDELLSQEDVYTDVSRLMELNKEKESIQKELEVLYEKWEELAE